MIHKVFTVDISDDGILTGQNDGTQCMTKGEAKACMSFLISHALRIGIVAGIKSDAEMQPIFDLAKKMIAHSREYMN